jgi:hypothetical protein
MAAFDCFSVLCARPMAAHSACVGTVFALGNGPSISRVYVALDRVEDLTRKSSAVKLHFSHLDYVEAKITTARRTAPLLRIMMTSAGASLSVNVNNTSCICD